VAVGVGGAVETRNTQSLINVSLRQPLFWDGRARDLEDQVHFPLADPREMSFPIEKAARRLSTVAGYRPLFAEAFGDAAVTPRRIASAIAAFERTLISLDSPYDRYAAGDSKALSDSAKRGLEVFRTKGRCFACHELSPADRQQFADIGLPQRKGAPDPGRYAVSKAEVDRRAFRIPDLRALKYTAPYMHDGSLGTLAEVVDFYDRGGGPDPNKSGWITPLHLTAGEKADLVSFLESMSGDPLAQDPPARLPE
jgi:cytochrome c peroxidase